MLFQHVNSTPVLSSRLSSYPRTGELPSLCSTPHVYRQAASCPLHHLVCFRLGLGHEFWDGIFRGKHTR